MKVRTATVQELVDEGTIAPPMDGNHGGIHPKTSDYVSSGIPFVMASDLANGTVDTSNCAFISESQAQSLRKGFAVAGDVLLSHKATIGRTAVVPPINTPFIMLTPQLTYYRVLREDVLDRDYLYYYFNARPFQELFAQWSGAGSTRAYLGITAQRKLPIVFPNLDVQKRVSRKLKIPDDKIDLNRRMNTTLEAMARAVFRDWFVDFGPTRRKAAGETDPVAILGGLLPDPTKATELAALFPESFGGNGLPEGWEAKTLGDVVEPRKGRNITKKTVVPGDVPVVAGGLNPAYYHNTPNVTGPVITASASGANAGFVRLYHQNIWASDCSFISRAQTDHLFTVYALLTSRQDEIYSMQQGAAQPHIYPSDLKRFTIVDAPLPIWQALEALLTPMFELVANNEKENQTLAATRDLLLPKLMSGELRLKDAEGMV